MTRRDADTKRATKPTSSPSRKPLTSSGGSGGPAAMGRSRNVPRAQALDKRIPAL